MQSVRVCVHHVTCRFTAMDDLTACSWKKTLPPSSGHTVRISSLVIPRSSLPVSTPSVFTVLRAKKKQNNKKRMNKWRCFRQTQGRQHLSLCVSHILEKPLYSSQALTCGDEEVMSRVGGDPTPRLVGCGGEQRGQKVVVTQQGGRPCRRTYRRIGRESVAPQCLQDSLWNVAFIAELVANEPPLFGLLDHLQSAKTKRCNLSNLEEKMAHLARCLHPRFWLASAGPQTSERRQQGDLIGWSRCLARVLSWYWTSKEMSLCDITKDKFQMWMFQHTFWKAQQAKEVFLMLEISKASFKMTWQYFRHKLTLKNCSVLRSVNKPFHCKTLKLKDA